MMVMKLSSPSLILVIIGLSALYSNLLQKGAIVPEV